MSAWRCTYAVSASSALLPGFAPVSVSAAIVTCRIKARDGRYRVSITMRRLEDEDTMEAEASDPVHALAAAMHAARVEGFDEELMRRACGVARLYGEPS